MRAAWFCANKQLRRSKRSWIGLAILFGLFAGAASLAVAGADRTASAFDRLAAKTRAPDIVAVSECPDPTCAGTADRLSTIPSVSAVAPMVTMTAALRRADGKPLSIGDPCYTGAGEVDLILPVDDRWGADVNRFDLARGSLPDPASPDEVLIASEIARRFDLDVGDTLSMHGDACDDGAGKAARTRNLRVVGIERSTFEQQPEIGFYLLGVHGTQALLRALQQDGMQFHADISLRLRPSTTVTQVVRQAGDRGISIEPVLTHAEIRRGIAKSTRPDEVAALILGFFGMIAALVVVGPVMIQLAASNGPELRILRTLGFTRGDLVRVSLLSGLFVGTAAALVAGALAVGLSPLFPIAEARRFEPSPGFHASALVWVGMAATASTTILLIMLGTLLGARTSQSTRFVSVTSASRFVRRLRLPPTIATGVRMALELRNGAASALAIFGVSAGVVGLVAALTFSASLRHLDRTPSLVGWNWDVGAFLAGKEGEPPLTREGVERLRLGLLTVPGVERASLATYFPPQFPILDRNTFPMAFSTGVDAVVPTVIAGRAPTGPAEVMLNPHLARRLGVAIGDHVDLHRSDPNDPGRASSATVPFEIVGTGIVPIGDGRVDVGFSLTLDGLATLTPDATPHMAYIALERGADRRRFAETLVSRGDVEDGSVIQGIRSSKLVQLDLAQVSQTPRIVAGLFTLAGVAVLIQGVVSAGRKRRRELAILRAIGLSARQATRVSVWQAITSTLVGVGIAVPVGVVVGAALWSLYATGIGVKVHTATDVWRIGLVAACGLGLAAAVAFPPSWLAAKRVSADVLRPE